MSEREMENIESAEQASFESFEAHSETENEITIEHCQKHLFHPLESTFTLKNQHTHTKADRTIFMTVRFNELFYSVFVD